MTPTSPDSIDVSTLGNIDNEINIGIVMIV